MSKYRGGKDWSKQFTGSGGALASRPCAKTSTQQQQTLACGAGAESSSGGWRVASVEDIWVDGVSLQ